jgi:hypothetical protein
LVSILRSRLARKLRREAAVADHARDIERARARIDVYLVAHPLAADTVIGVARWWIGPPYDLSLETVEAVLDLLVEEGRIVRMINPDGGVVFAAARR